MTNNIKQLKAERVFTYHDIVCQYLPPIDLCQPWGTSIFGGTNFFHATKLDRASEVLFPQDVPKIIFIDADQAGLFVDRFLLATPAMFFFFF